MNNDFLAGFVAGEGIFVIYHRKRYKTGDALDFSFQITLAWDDLSILKEVQSFLGVGKIYHRKSQKENWQPAAHYRIHVRRFLVEKIVPIMDAHLLPVACKKARQYLQWKDQLLAYDANPPMIGRHRNGYGGVGRKPKLNRDLTEG